MKRALLGGFLLLLTACAGQSQASTLPSASSHVASNSRYPELDRLPELIEGGRCGEALATVLGPVIERMERNYPEPRHSDRALEVAAETATRVLNDSMPSGTGVLFVTGNAPTIYPDTLYHAAFCYIELGRLTDAERLLERAIAVMEDFVYLNELGHIYQTRRQFADAIPIYERALASVARLAAREPELRPLGRDLAFWKRRSMRGVGFSLVELGRLDEAEALYRDVLAIDPTDAQAQRELVLIAEIRAGRSDVGPPSPSQSL